MPEHASRRLLFESLGISVIDFRCHACVEKLGTEEPNPTHSIVLVRRGVFGRSHEGRSLVADPNHVLFFNAAEGYRYSHPVAGGDDCTILAVESARALELVARHAPRDPRPESPFRLSHGLSSRRAAALHWELLQLVDRPAPRLALEDLLAELADEAVGGAYRSPGARAISPAWHSSSATSTTATSPGPSGMSGGSRRRDSAPGNNVQAGARRLSYDFLRGGCALSGAGPARTREDTMTPRRTAMRGIAVGWATAAVLSLTNRS